MKLLLDTNAYSDYVRGDQTITDYLNQASLIYLPVIVIGELKRGFYRGTRIKTNGDSLQKFIAKPRTRLLDVDQETAEHYGQLAAYLKKQGTPIPVNDIWIAALCVQHDLPLLTRDDDFRNLPQVVRV